MANNIVATWGFKRKLPEPFEDYTDHAIFDDIASKYCTQPRKKSTLHAATLRAVLAYLELENPVGSTPPEKLGAVGTQSNNFVVAEYPSKTGDLQLVVYNQLNGKFYGGCYTPPPDVESTPEKYEFKDSKQSGAALLFALMPVFLADEECNEKYQELKAHRDNGYPNLDAAAETAAVLCDNIYRRTRYASGLPTGGVKIDLPANGVLSLIKPLNIQKGVYAPTEVLHGDFQVLRPGSGFKKAQAAISRDDFVGKFILTASRRLSPEEEVSVPTLAEWYIIPPEIKRICEHAKLTTDTTQPMRNFLLRGPAGTGKTEGAKAIASALHLPYRCITCSANTEVFDLLGQILPDVDGKRTRLQRQYPSFQEIQLDPSGAYQKLTGNYDEEISAEDTYQKLIDTIFDEMHSYYKEHTSGQNFQYVDTPLVEAIRYGYILEIQEPTVIANPGVLVGLNSLLDRCNSVYLPNGETIHRHPDTTIVITTNNDYAGCKQMNQSVISRMNLVIDLDEPDEDTQVERAMAVTGCKDAKTVRLMTRIVKSMAVYCRENLITDGCCGMRELISWVQSYMVCGDIREAARYTVLASASADAENRTEVEESCLDTVLAA